MRIALVVYDGVLDDECEAFRSVLGLITGAEVVTVGARAGHHTGPGGGQDADRSFDGLGDADVVVVPGGLGLARAADDPSLRAFLHRMEHSARFIAASSTGSVVLASAGLLHGRPAATHWLATDLLRRYGSEADERRLVVSGNVVTCEGRISAVDAAFTLVARLEHPGAVDRIRATLIERGRPLLREPTLVERVLERTLGRATLRRPRRPRRPTPDGAPAGSAATPPVTPLSVMVELVDDDELVRRMKRRARRARSAPDDGAEADGASGHAGSRPH